MFRHVLTPVSVLFADGVSVPVSLKEGLVLLIWREDLKLGNKCDPHKYSEILVPFSFSFTSLI